MPLIERVLDRRVCDTLDSYVSRGGGAGLDAARRLGPSAIVDEIEAAGLRGRGGAGFPTGVKWRTVSSAGSGQRTPVVVNGAEGEPATFKDRELMRINPFKILEGALIAALVVDAPEIVVALKSTFGPEIERVRDAIEAVKRAGWTDGVELRVVEGPSEYLFGEETALLEVIEGRQPFPRITPPYRRGLELPPVGDFAPVLVDNVETLANVPAILARGAAWFREVGTADSPGTLVCTMTGHCRRHAVGEVPMGTPLREAIELIGGGGNDGRRIVAALSGVANPIVPEHLLDTPLSYEAMEGVGSGLGAGGFFLFDDETDAAAVVSAAARFLAVESCGQCEPCKRDGLAIADRLRSICAGEATQLELDELPGRLATVADGARCFLATQQQRVVGSALQLFPGVFAAHVNGTLASAAVEEVVPVVDIVDGHAVLETSHLDKQPDWSYAEVDSGAWPAAALAREPVELDQPEPRDAPADAEGPIVNGEFEGPDPLKPLVDMQRDIRGALDRLVTADDGARPDAIEELRARLRLYDDVTRRVVHPMADRVVGGRADDATWQAEHEEAAAGRLLSQLDTVDANSTDVARSLRALVTEVGRAIDRDETQLMNLLRSQMNEEDLRGLGDAIQEAAQPPA